MPPGIHLADPTFADTNPVDVIIGAEIFFELFRVPGRISLGENQPVLVNSVFGWVVSGKSTSRQSTPIVANFAIVTPNQAKAPTPEAQLRKYNARPKVHQPIAPLLHLTPNINEVSTKNTAVVEPLINELTIQQAKSQQTTNQSLACNKPQAECRSSQHRSPNHSSRDKTTLWSAKTVIDFDQWIHNTNLASVVIRIFIATYSPTVVSVVIAFPKFSSTSHRSIPNPTTSPITQNRLHEIIVPIGIKSPKVSLHNHHKWYHQAACRSNNLFRQWDSVIGARTITSIRHKPTHSSPLQSIADSIVPSSEDYHPNETVSPSAYSVVLHPKAAPNQPLARFSENPPSSFASLYCTIIVKPTLDFDNTNDRLKFISSPWEAPRTKQIKAFYQEGHASNFGTIQNKSSRSNAYASHPSSASCQRYRSLTETSFLRGQYVRICPAHHEKGNYAPPVCQPFKYIRRYFSSLLSFVENDKSSKATKRLSWRTTAFRGTMI
nr:uncharacterized protein LOC115254503 [Aedes albopictus]